MKWIIFRIAVYFYLRDNLKKHDYHRQFCWAYSDCFENFFEDVQWRTIIEDAEEAVLEDLSCWD